jgi:hypothetical protein
MVFCPSNQRVIQYKHDSRKVMLLQTKLENPAANLTCEARLLFDTGFNGDLLLSEYKAQQLGLKKYLECNLRPIIVGGGKELGLCYYDYLKCTLMVRDLDGEGVVEDVQQMRLLEVLSIVGTLSLESSNVFQDPTLGVSLESDGVEVSSPDLSQLLGENPPSLKLSPIKGGKNRFCHDAILGLPGVNRLRVGFDAEKNCLFPVEIHHQLL